MNIQILMLTCNRPHYTEISLRGLLDSVPPFAQVTVWDNASGPETKAVIEKLSGHGRMAEVIFSETNKKLREPTNWFWRKHGQADYVSKIDDDCLQHPGWCEALLNTHASFSDSGIVGSWRFFPSDNLECLPPGKIIRGTSASLMRNCWVQGSGYLMRTAVIRKLGLLREGESFPHYCIRAAKAGFINGFAYPFVFEDHFDDPRSVHTQFRTDEDFLAAIPLTARQFEISSLEQWTDFQKREARILQTASWRPGDYIGLRNKVKRTISGIKSLCRDRLKPFFDRNASGSAADTG